LTGFLYFVKINVALANRGVAQVDLPPEHSEAAERRVLSLNYSGRFEQWPVGPTLFLRDGQRIRSWDDAPRRFVVSAAVPSG
jgi:hypothetical protein